MRQRGDGCVVIAEVCLNLGQRLLSPWLVHRVAVVVFDRAFRLLQSLFLFAKPGISERESVRYSVRIGWDGNVKSRPTHCDGATETSPRIFIVTCPQLTIATLDQHELNIRIERLSRRE